MRGSFREVIVSVALLRTDNDVESTDASLEMECALQAGGS
jgi:hypothetical protein